MLLGRCPMRALLLATALFASSIFGANANIITVTYEGTASGFIELRCTPFVGCLSVPFSEFATETYTFDTALGLLTPLTDGFQLTGGFVSGSITLPTATDASFGNNSLIISGSSIDTPFGPFFGDPRMAV